MYGQLCVAIAVCRHCCVMWSTHESTTRQRILARLHRILYDRDCHRQFCPPALWTAPYLALPNRGAALGTLLQSDAVLRLLAAPGASNAGSVVLRRMACLQNMFFLLVVCLLLVCIGCMYADSFSLCVRIHVYKIPSWLPSSTPPTTPSPPRNHVIMPAPIIAQGPNQQ